MTTEELERLWCIAVRDDVFSHLIPSDVRVLIGTVKNQNAALAAKDTELERVREALRHARIFITNANSHNDRPTRAFVADVIDTALDSGKG